MAVLTNTGSFDAALNMYPDYKEANQTGANRGQSYYRFEFLTGDNIDNGDTFDTGGLRITECAWTAVNSSDYVIANATGNGKSVVEFTTSGNNHNGVLHVWADE